MYIDNMTLVALVVFAVALGSFIKICLMNSCLTDGDSTDKDQ